MISKIVYGAITVMLFFFLGAGKVTLLVYPGFELMLWFTAVILAIFVGSSFFIKTPKQFSIWHAVLLVPVLVGFALPPAPLSSSTAEKRGVSLSIETPEQKPIFRFATNTDNLDILGWLRALSLNYDTSRYVGKKVKVQGFVAEGPTSDTFLIARFVVSCCVADARPLGLAVKIEGTVPASNTWLEISGVMQEMETEHGKTLVIHPETISPIPTPSNPYVYY